MIFDEDKGKILSVISQATLADVQALFELADAKWDLCLQNVTYYSVIFGGSNRVFVYKDGMIQVSKSHCDEKFLAIAKELGYDEV